MFAYSLFDLFQMRRVFPARRGGPSTAGKTLQMNDTL